MESKLRICLPIMLSLSIVVSGCSNSRYVIDPEEQNVYVDDGVDHYMAEGDDIEETLHIAHGQYIIGDEGDRTYTVNAVEEKGYTHHYIGDIRLVKTIQDGPGGFRLLLHQIHHPDFGKIRTSERSRLIVPKGEDD